VFVLIEKKKPGANRLQRCVRFGSHGIWNPDLWNTSTSTQPSKQ